MNFDFVSYCRFQDKSLNMRFAYDKSLRVTLLRMALDDRCFSISVPLAVVGVRVEKLHGLKMFLLPSIAVEWF